MPRPPAYRDRRGSGGKILGLSCLGCVGVAVAGALGLGVAVVVIVALVGSKVREAADAHASRPTRPDTPAVKPAPVKPAPRPSVTGVKVIAGFIYDAAEARQKYTDALVTISGTVQSRERVGRGVRVTLARVEGNRAVATAVFQPPHDEAALAFPVGGYVTLKGRLTTGDFSSEGIVSMTLSDCEPAQ